MRDCVREQRKLVHDRQVVQAKVNRLRAEARAMLLEVEFIDMVLAKGDDSVMQIVIQRLGIDT